MNFSKYYLQVHPKINPKLSYLEAINFRQEHVGDYFTNIQAVIRCRYLISDWQKYKDQKELVRHLHQSNVACT